MSRAADWRWFLLALVSLSSPALAADFSLPLDGYYRPGRYMPVRFDAAPAELRLAASGAVTTVIPSPTGGIAPWLITATVRDAPFAQPLHELQPNDKLVGYTTDARKAASILFPNSTVMAVELDAANPIAGPAAAWQTLDAVVLDLSAMSALSNQTKASLLAAGAALAAPASAATPPDDVWPWRRDRGFWILTAPQGAIAAAGDEVYQPVADWQPGRSARYRAQIVILGLIVALALLAVLLLKIPRTIAAWLPLPVAIVAVVAVTVWDAAQPAIATAVGVVHIMGSPAAMDTWLFECAARDGPTSVPFSALALPILPTRGGPRQMALFCDGSGNPVEFRFNLARGLPAAFVFKSVSNAPLTGQISTAVTSPLRWLISSAYAEAFIVGQGIMPLAAGDDLTQWPPLVLARSDDMPKNLNPAVGRDSSKR